jgi:hypothetical protein
MPCLHPIPSLAGDTLYYFLVLPALQRARRINQSSAGNQASERIPQYPRLLLVQLLDIRRF